MQGPGGIQPRLPRHFSQNSVLKSPWQVYSETYLPYCGFFVLICLDFKSVVCIIVATMDLEWDENNGERERNDSYYIDEKGIEKGAQKI